MVAHPFHSPRERIMNSLFIFFFSFPPSVKLLKMAVDGSGGSISFCSPPPPSCYTLRSCKFQGGNFRPVPRKPPLLFVSSFLLSLADARFARFFPLERMLKRGELVTRMLHAYCCYHRAICGNSSDFKLGPCPLTCYSTLYMVSVKK